MKILFVILSFLGLCAWCILAVLAFGYVGLDGATPIRGFRAISLIFPAVYFIYLIYSVLSDISGRTLIASGTMIHIFLLAAMILLLVGVHDASSIVLPVAFSVMSLFWVWICLPRFTGKAEQGAAANP